MTSKQTNSHKLTYFFDEWWTRVAMAEIAFKTDSRPLYDSARAPLVDAVRELRKEFWDAGMEARSAIVAALEGEDMTAEEAEMAVMNDAVVMVDALMSEHGIEK